MTRPKETSYLQVGLYSNSLRNSSNTALVDADMQSLSTGSMLNKHKHRTLRLDPPPSKESKTSKRSVSSQKKNEVKNGVSFFGAEKGSSQPSRRWHNSAQSDTTLVPQQESLEIWDSFEKSVLDSWSLVRKVKDPPLSSPDDDLAGHLKQKPKLRSSSNKRVKIVSPHTSESHFDPGSSSKRSEYMMSSSPSNSSTCEPSQLLTRGEYTSKILTPDSPAWKVQTKSACFTISPEYDNYQVTVKWLSREEKNALEAGGADHQPEFERNNRSVKGKKGRYDKMYFRKENQLVEVQWRLLS